MELQPFVPVRRAILRTCVSAAIALACGAPAEAQIYSWRDAEGRMVLSNVPQGANLGIAPSPDPDAPSPAASAAAGETPTIEVAPTDRVRTTYVAPGRARAFDEIIEDAANRGGVRKDLVRAVIQVESAFNPRAVSNKGAMGLMQLMPDTARELGVANAFDPEQNIRGGVAYLRQLLDRYEGNETLALAAYNAGPGAVDRHGQVVPPYRETRSYVSKVNSLAGERTGTRKRIYRIVEVIDGREVVKYTDVKPSAAN